MNEMIASEEAISLKLFVVLSKAYKTIVEEAMKDMKKYELSPSEFMVLEVLYNKGKTPLQQIGDKILVTSGSITYNIDKLEKKGLLKRVPCDSDRRVTYAEMTEKGSQWFGQIFPEHARLVHSIMNGLNAEEKLTMIDSLKRLGKSAQTP